MVAVQVPGAAGLGMGGGRVPNHRLQVRLVGECLLLPRGPAFKYTAQPLTCTLHSVLLPVINMHANQPTPHPRFGRHHPSDVAAGAFLGTLVATFYAIRAIFRLELVVLCPLCAELAPSGGCVASDGCSAGTEPGASLLHGAGGARVYQEQSSV